MRQLPQDHALLVKYRETLSLTHGAGSDAAKNYLANVAVEEWLRVR